MPEYNKDMQQRKNCELYAYVLAELDKEIPDDILECVMDGDYLVDCVLQLANELKALDTEKFNQLVYNSEASLSRDLANWWTMYQESERLQEELRQTCL
jgi:hypothetical protein